MTKKSESPTSSTSPKSKIGRDSSSGQFFARAEKWATANSASKEAASSKLKDMGIYDRNGKLAKDYR